MRHARKCRGGGHEQHRVVHRHRGCRRGGCRIRRPSTIRSRRFGAVLRCQYAHVRNGWPGLDTVFARYRERTDHACRRTGLRRDRWQTDVAAPAHADRRPRRSAPDRDAGAWPRRSCQRGIQGALGPRASGRCHTVWRPRPLHILVGSPRPVHGKLFVHRRRALRRVLDAGARRAGAAAMAVTDLQRGARLRSVCWRPAHRRWRPFLYGCRLCRRVHVPAGVGRARPDLSLATDAVDRQGHRAAARMGGRRGPRRVGRAGAAGRGAQEPARRRLSTTPTRRWPASLLRCRACL